MKFSSTLLGLGIGVFASGAAALSWGEAHGSVVLGGPIDLVFDVHTDPGTDLDMACIKATATAGETRIDSSRLRIVAQPLVAGRPPSVRIRSSIPVMEPILSVELAVGCADAVSRTYHFFADLPAQASSGTLPLLIARPVVPGGASEGVTVQRPGAAARLQGARVPAAAADPVPLQPKLRHQPLVDTAPSREETPPAKLAPKVVAQPPGDGLTPPAPLRLPPNLHTVLPKPLTAAQHTQQVDALGQALKTAAEDLRQASKQLLQQQADIVATRAHNAKMQAALTDLQQRLDRPGDERSLSTLVYGLSGLLAAALALLGWLGVRKQSPQSRSGLASQPAEILHADDFGVAPKEPPDYPEMAPSDRTPLVPDAAPVLPGAAAFPVLSPAVAPITDPAPLESSPLAAVEPAARVVHPEELFDLQQQAEFFMSVGEHDQAIEVMKKHIAENEKTSPLIYLELLRLYRALSRIADFNHLRVQFHQYFNAEVPDFSGFHGAHRTLFDYPESLASIEALWCDASVLPLLESYIFCSDKGNAEGRFELQAYEDLLMLYAIASTIPASARGVASLRRRTTPRAEETPQAAVLPTPGLLDKNPDLDLGLDAHWNRSLQEDAHPVSDAPVDNHLLEFENFVLSGTGTAPLDAVSHRTTARERSLDIDLTQPELPDFGQALSEFDFHENSSVPGSPVLSQSEVMDPFEALFDLEKRDPGRS